MSFTSQVGQVIQGDSATTAATWVPTLNAGVDQKKFMITADPGELNLNTPLILNDNYYHRSDDRTFTTYTTNSTTQQTVQIQGVTSNMAYLNSAYLEFDLQLSFAAGLPRNAPDDPTPLISDCICDLAGIPLQRFKGPYTTTTWQVVSPHQVSTPVPNVAAIYKSDDYIPYMNGAVFEAPAIWQMEVIENVTIEIGNNVQTLGRSAGQGMSIIKAMNSLIIQDEKFIQLFGFFNSEAGLSSYNTSDYCKTDPLFKKFFHQLTNAHTGGDANVLGAQTIWNSQANATINFTIPIRIPFKLLNSAFNQPLETWWPAGMPYKLTIDFKLAPVPIFTSPYYFSKDGTPAAGGNPAIPQESFPLWQWTGKVGLLTNTSIYMQTHLLRQPTQEALNLQWTSSPYLYQYITSEPFRIKCDGVNTLFNLNIAVNQQCPTHIIFYCEWAINPPNGVFLNVRGGGAPADVAERGDYFYRGSAVYTGTAPAAAIDYTNFRLTRQAYQRHGYRRNNPMPMFLNSLKLIMTGTKKYEVKWNNGGFINCNTGSEIQKDLISFSAYNRHDITNTKSIQNTNYGVGNYYHLTVHPGLMLDVGYQSTDWGAQVINLELEVYNKGCVEFMTTPRLPTAATTSLTGLTALPNTHQITVVKVLPEQYNLDINRNVSIVKYPAVTTTSGYILPTASSINAN